MRSLLTYGIMSVASLVFFGSASAETIAWIDPPATRSIGVAEASGVKTLDIDHETVTRGSLAALAEAGADDPVTAPEASAAVSVAVPLAGLQAITGGADAPDRPEARAWMLSLGRRQAPVGIDPYPTWSGAALVIDDVTSIQVASASPFGRPTTVATVGRDSSVVSLGGNRFFNW